MRCCQEQRRSCGKRVLRIHYGPHEKSVMHYHPATVAVFLTDVRVEGFDCMRGTPHAHERTQKQR
jgi:hypothetical protein